MEASWENWPLHMEMGGDEEYFLLDKCHHTDDEDFLRDILQLQQPAGFCSESESQSQSFHDSSTVVGAAATDGGSSISSEEITGTGSGNLVKSNSSNSIVCQSQHASKKPRIYILSFDNSTMIPATPELRINPEQSELGSAEGEGEGEDEGEGEGTRSNSKSPNNLPSKRTRPNQNPEPRPRANQGPPKKARSTSQTMDHIMAERKRRQELTERFIALAATIPGLKKTDKASILAAAIDYVKQLKERVKELEEKQESKSGAMKSMILIQKPDVYGNEDTITSETSSDDDCVTLNEALPEIEARLLEEEVLIEIHCEKESGIELKILDQLENLHLRVTGSSALPFGNSALGITIIAQMGDAYIMTVKDLVKNLRQVLLKSRELRCNSDPY